MIEKILLENALGSLDEIINPAYIHGIDYSGKGGRVAPNNISNGIFAHRGQYNGDEYDANDMVTTGLYSIQGIIKNVPEGCEWVDLVVFKANGLIQIITNKILMKIYRRVGYVGTNNVIERWGGWKEF